MNLQDQMAADALAVFMNTTEFATTADYFPGGSATSFACQLVLADIDEQFVSVHSGSAEKRLVRAAGARTQLRTGIAGIEGTARDPDRGDRVVVTTAGDPMLGTWFVEAAVNDVGGVVGFTLRADTRYEAAGAGAVEVSG